MGCRPFSGSPSCLQVVPHLTISRTHHTTRPGTLTPPAGQAAGNMNSNLVQHLLCEIFLGCIRMIRSLLYVFDMIPSKKKKLSVTERQTAIKYTRSTRQDSRNRHQIPDNSVRCRRTHVRDTNTTRRTINLLTR